ncbi:type II secretion system protein [Caenispirillum bisanense]|nr:prepilin-type N-terminal cleavage/methylation domain-containing protein [Caenispirillum bisanense]
MDKTAPRGDANASQKGFTLIELSIVLVIIGLLVGGVIKGKDLIDNTKTTKFIQEVQAYQDAITAYEERYGADPFNDTLQRFGEANNTDSATATLRLRIAGLISLAPGANTPTNAVALHVFNDSITFLAGNVMAGTATNLGTANDTLVCFEGVPSEAAAAADTKYDDGVANTGNIRAATEATAGTAVTATATASFGTNTATVCALAN